MATAMFVEVLDYSQHSMWLIPESQSCALYHSKRSGFISDVFNTKKEKLIHENTVTQTDHLGYCSAESIFKMYFGLSSLYMTAKFDPTV
jgi:hypothetical protein